jgi:hypothetical protein
VLGTAIDDGPHTPLRLPARRHPRAGRRRREPLGDPMSTAILLLLGLVSDEDYWRIQDARRRGLRYQVARPPSRCSCSSPARRSGPGERDVLSRAQLPAVPTVTIDYSAFAAWSRALERRAAQREREDAAAPTPRRRATPRSSVDRTATPFGEPQSSPADPTLDHGAAHNQRSVTGRSRKALGPAPTT